METTVVKKEEEANFESDDPIPLSYQEISDFTRLTRTPKINPKSLEFLKKQFPTASRNEWNDWKWQLLHSVTKLEHLKQFIHLSEEEYGAILNQGTQLPLRVTPYYASLLSSKDKDHPLRKSVIPDIAEMVTSYGEAEDPLNEDADSPVPGIVHRYPDRVLFLVTSFCSTYCRYCTRSRLVGDQHSFSTRNWDIALEYIESHPEIRDVLLSGGDPLTMTTDRLEYLLFRLRRIKHVEMIRIGTKVPVVLPQRITTELTQMLRKYHPLYISIHFIHPEEITEETAAACEKLANAGIPLGSQTVLLKGINDNVETMKKLMHTLLQIRVKPYYIYQCDPIIGSAHFRTTIDQGLDIVRGLRGHTSGYGVPHYVIDAPGGGGKIPLLPDYFVSKDAENAYIKNYKGEIYKYPNNPYL